jgi:hypothetical protein
VNVLLDLRLLGHHNLHLGFEIVRNPPLNLALGMFDWLTLGVVRKSLGFLPIVCPCLASIPHPCRIAPSFLGTKCGLRSLVPSSVCKGGAYMRIWSTRRPRIITSKHGYMRRRQARRKRKATPCYSFAIANLWST